MPSTTVRVARLSDRADFLAWAAEVEHLFGPMVGNPGFEAPLDNAIARGCAWVAVEGATGRCVGGVLVSLESREIGWLVVSRSARGLGAGRALIAAALAALGPGTVRVETFADSHPEGVPAHALYERFGFHPGQAGRGTPAGIATQVLVRA